ncbi:MAG: dephospho-CoA kinase [Flavobacteriales bacterium]
MKVIGLTGGIGSGKSTVARVFERLGVPVFYADLVAKAAYTEPSIQLSVTSLFGSDIFENGVLNRAILAERVFSSPSLLAQLNALIHPYVAEQWRIWRKQHSSSPYVIREAAILIESGSYQDCDAIIQVTAPIEDRIKRVCKRDGTSEEQVRSRMNNQLSDEERMKYAQYELKNDNRESLLETILRLDNYFRS